MIFEKTKSGLLVSRRKLFRDAATLVCAPAIIGIDRALAQIGGGLMFPWPTSRVLDPRALTFTASTATLSGASSYSFTSQGFGTAYPSRFMILGIGWGGNVPTISSLTIGGISATLVGSCLAVGVWGTSAIYSAPVPTGTSGTVAVTFSGTTGIGCGIGLWSLTGFSSVTPLSSGNNVAAVGSVSLGTTANGGFAVGYAVTTANIGGSSASWTWTGVPKDFNASIQSGSNDRSHSGAHGGTSSGGLTVTASTTVQTAGLCAAAW